MAAIALLSLSSAFAQFPRATGEIVAPPPAKKPAKQNQTTAPPKTPNQVAPAKQGTAVTSTKTSRGKPSAQKSGQKLVEEPLVAPLPTPTTLAQMPPVAPKVTFAGGQLTIDAPNSRLSDVISAVRRATGTTFEGATSDERVAVKLGPGASRDVITALLHGSRLDYIIVAADKDPSQAQRVLLMQSGTAPQPGTVAQGPPRPNQQVNQGDPDMGDEPTNTDEIPDQTVTEPPPSNNNAEIENQNNQQNQQENNQNQQQQPKTPEQLLQELQQLQQQQQQLQQMQQNNPNNQNQQNQNPPQ